MPTSIATEELRRLPSVSCGELASYLAEKDEAEALVTTLDGALVGLASRDLDACAGAAAGEAT